MDKRNQKLRNMLQMALLRLKEKDTLKKIELSWGENKEIIEVDSKNPLQLIFQEQTFKREFLPQFLEKKLENKERAEIKIIERGTVIKLSLLPSDVKMEINTQDQQTQHTRPPEFGTRQNFIRAGEAQELLKTLDIMSPEGQIKADKRRKYFQVDRFVELIDEIIKDHPDDKKFSILDCGCGKSYLSFVLNYWLTEKKRVPCRVIGIDENSEVIEKSKKIQKKLGYNNMEFRQGKIMDFKPSYPIDMVLSLHACDTATDEALALGIYLKSKYIIAVPCCQAALHNKINFTPWEGIDRHRVFHNRLADIFTDGVRVSALEAKNYRVSVVEYVSPLETPKNIMLRATSGYPQPGAGERLKNLKKQVSREIPLENFLKTFKQL